MNDSSHHGSHDRDGVILVLAVIGLLLIARLAFGITPHDLSAYVVGADLFTRGLSPYLDYTQSPHYEGYPFVYMPGALPFFAPLALLPTAAILALDAILRVSVFALCVRTLVGWLKIQVEWPKVFLVTLVSLYAAYIDVLTGNFATFMLGQALCAVWLSRRPQAARWPVAATGLLGVSVMIKPTWALGVLVVFVMARRWRQAASFLVGCALFLTASVMQVQAFADWRVLLGQVTSYWWESRNFWTTSPLLWGLVAACWGVATLLIWRKRPEHAWVWGMSAVMLWPRHGYYSYLVLLPIHAYLYARLGAWKTLALSLAFISPLPRLLELNGVTVFGLDLVLCWAVGVSAVTWWLLYHGEPEDVASPSALSAKA